MSTGSRPLALVSGVLCALALAAPASGAVRESAFVERATAPYRATASCYDRSDWATLVVSGHPEFRGHESDVYGLWLYDIRQVALPARACTALEHWRSTSASSVSLWIFVLGHELTHVEQSDFYNAPWSRPFDEKEADCGGFAKFQRIRISLGITRRLTPPSRRLFSCPARTARPRR
jgi:hypothetical protein